MPFVPNAKLKAGGRCKKTDLEIRLSAPPGLREKHAGSSMRVAATFGHSPDFKSRLERSNPGRLARLLLASQFISQNIVTESSTTTSAASISGEAEASASSY